MRQNVKNRIKLQKLAESPRCAACGCELTIEPNEENSAHLVRKCLSCPRHIKAVRKLGKHGGDEAVIVLTAKAVEYLNAYRSRKYWFVDGVQYDCEKRAERAAQTLAKLLGCRVDILSGRDRQSAKVVEIVRPGDDARFRDDSFHFERRSTIDFSHTGAAQ